MKCGREIPSGNVFCEDCLRDMANYPVKPGTVVNIPPQTRQTARRPERRQPTQQQRLESLQRRVRILGYALTLSVALLIGSGALLLSLLQEVDDGPLPGQNYSTAESTGSTGQNATEDSTEASPSESSEIPAKSGRKGEAVSRETGRSRNAVPMFHVKQTPQ